MSFLLSRGQYRSERASGGSSSRDEDNLARNMADGEHRPPKRHADQNRSRSSWRQRDMRRSSHMTNSVNTTPTIAMTMIGTNSLAVANTLAYSTIMPPSPLIAVKNSPTMMPMMASPTDSRTPAMMNGIAAGSTILKKICASVAP